MVLQLEHAALFLISVLLAIFVIQYLRFFPLLQFIFHRYQNELPGLVSSRNEPHLKHEELCRLMTWKLTVSTVCI